MKPPELSTDRPGWHDRAVANAADAWLNDPRDHEVYRRLVDAVRRRRDWLAPTLGIAAPNEMDRPLPAHLNSPMHWGRTDRRSSSGRPSTSGLSSPPRLSDPVPASTPEKEVAQAGPS